MTARADVALRLALVKLSRDDVKVAAIGLTSAIVASRALQTFLRTSWNVLTKPPRFQARGHSDTD